MQKIITLKEQCLAVQDSIQATKHVFWPNLCKNYWQHTKWQFNPMFTLAFLYIGQAFRKIWVLPANYPCKLVKIGKEWQKNRGNLLYFEDKFLVIPILNSKHMSCLPNATLINDGNVPGMTLWVKKMLSSMITAKN